MKKGWLKDPPPIVTWISATIGILGTPIVAVLQYFNDDKKLIVLISVVVVALSIVASIIIIRIQKYKYQTDIAIKTRDYEDKCKELEAKNREMEEIVEDLANKNSQIDELKNRIVACKKALNDKTKLTSLDYYLIDKDIYDEFKTPLRVLECYLEVELIEGEENPEKHDLSFKWRLKIENPESMPAGMARFIYLGKKDDDSDPTVTSEGVMCEKEPSKREDIKVLSNDRFIEIDFIDELAGGGRAEINIDYVLKAYGFNRECDTICIVPDALGFADMEKFIIRFYCDGEIVHKKTKVKLNSYKLEGEYNLKTEKTVNSKELSNGKIGFEAKSRRKDELHNRGYMLELTNNGTTK